MFSPIAKQYLLWWGHVCIAYSSERAVLFGDFKGIFVFSLSSLMNEWIHMTKSSLDDAFQTRPCFLSRCLRHPPLCVIATQHVRMQLYF